MRLRQGLGSGRGAVLLRSWGQVRRRDGLRALPRRVLALLRNGAAAVATGSAVAPAITAVTTSASKQATTTKPTHLTAAATVATFPTKAAGPSESASASIATDAAASSVRVHH